LALLKDETTAQEEQAHRGKNLRQPVSYFWDPRNQEESGKMHFAYSRTTSTRFGMALIELPGKWLGTTIERRGERRSSRSKEQALPVASFFGGPFPSPKQLTSNAEWVDSRRKPKDRGSDGSSGVNRP